MSNMRIDAEPTARYKQLITIHQGFMEDWYLPAPAHGGVKVDRPCKPTKLEFCASEHELKDPNTFAIGVSQLFLLRRWYASWFILTS